MRFSLYISCMYVPATIQNSSICSKEKPVLRFPKSNGRISSWTSPILASRLVAQFSKWENMSPRLRSEDGHCRTRCLTSSGTESSQSGQLLANIVSFLSLTSSILNKLAWHTSHAIVSHTLMYSGYLSDSAHHVKYSDLGFMPLIRSRDFCSLYSMLCPLECRTLRLWTAQNLSAKILNCQAFGCNNDSPNKRMYQ